MLELFVDKIYFFKFLSMSNKPLGLAKNYHCYLYTVRASLNLCIHTRKEKCAVLKTKTLLDPVTPALNGVISCDMALKGPALYVCL